MKKLLTFIITTVMLLMFALPAMAGSRAEMSSGMRDQLDTFFSNFAEARVGSFVVNNEIPMDTFVNFGVQHNLINRKYDPKGSGEGLVFAQIAEWHENGTDFFTGVVNVYSTSSGFTGNVHGSAAEWNNLEPQDRPILIERFSFTATRSPSDPDRFVLVDWLEMK